MIEVQTGQRRCQRTNYRRWKTGTAKQGLDVTVSQVFRDAAPQHLHCGICAISGGNTTAPDFDKARRVWRICQQWCQIKLSRRIKSTCGPRPITRHQTVGPDNGLSRSLRMIKHQQMITMTIESIGLEPGQMPGGRQWCPHFPGKDPIPQRLGRANIVVVFCQPNFEPT